MLAFFDQDTTVDNSVRHSLRLLKEAWNIARKIVNRVKIQGFDGIRGWMNPRLGRWVTEMPLEVAIAEPCSIPAAEFLPGRILKTAAGVLFESPFTPDHSLTGRGRRSFYQY